MRPFKYDIFRAPVIAVLFISENWPWLPGSMSFILYTFPPFGISKCVFDSLGDFIITARMKWTICHFTALYAYTVLCKMSLWWKKGGHAAECAHMFQSPIYWLCCQMPFNKVWFLWHGLYCWSYLWPIITNHLYCWWVSRRGIKHHWHRVGDLQCFYRRCCIKCVHNQKTNSVAYKWNSSLTVRHKF